MGNSIASSIVEKQKEAQKDLAKVQLNNMIIGQERMRRQMIAQQIAIARERLWWMGGFGSAATLGLIGAKLGGKNPHAAAVVPLITFWTVFAYQWDFAYGTKPERINQMMNELINDPKNWFVPLLPTGTDDNAKKETKQ